VASQCQLYEDLLVEEALGEIGQKERMFLRAHLDSCGECRARLATLSDTIGVMKREKPAQAPAGLAERTLRRVETAGERFSAATSPYHETILTEPRSWRVRRSLVAWMVAASVLVMAVASLVPEWLGSGSARSLQTCQDHMTIIGTALRQYAADHNGAYPRGPEWYRALDFDYLQRQGVLMCPARMAVGPSSANVTDYLFNPTHVSVNEPADYPLMWDKNSAHDELGRNVLFVDGRVSWVAEEEFEKILIKYKISEADIPWLAPSTDTRGR